MPRSSRVLGSSHPTHSFSTANLASLDHFNAKGSGHQQFQQRQRPQPESFHAAESRLNPHSLTVGLWNRLGWLVNPLGKAPRFPLGCARVSKAGKATSAEAALPFEEALKQLESIVEAMETTDLPLDQLLERFEQGTRLAQACQGQLDLAEVRVQKLERSLGGRNELQPLASAESDLAD